MKIIRAVILLVLITLATSTYTFGAERNTKSTEQHIIFVGDSRTVGMSQSIDEDNVHFIGEVGSGYDWLKSTAIKQLSTCINEINSDNIIIVFNHGVNDPANIDRYMELYKDVAEDFGEYSIYFMSVNPCKQTSNREKLNSLIKDFNDTLQETNGIAFINSWSYLEENGFESADGLHYSSDTYDRLYGFVEETIDRDNKIKELRAAYNADIVKASKLSK